MGFQTMPLPTMWAVGLRGTRAYVCSPTGKTAAGQKCHHELRDGSRHDLLASDWLLVVDRCEPHGKAGSTAVVHAPKITSLQTQLSLANAVKLTGNQWFEGRLSQTDLELARLQ